MTATKKIVFFIALLFSMTDRVFTQDQLNPAVIEYIQTYQELAIREMQRTGVPASIKLAQGILETEAGRSDLVMRSNNHFGIKCKSSWTGEKVYHDDDERGECFRKYPEAESSYRDHSDYLRSQPRYAFLFTLDPEDYKGWAAGLKKAGYATNPKYTQMLIKFIETYGLSDYTLVALGKKSPESLSILPASQPAANSISTQPVTIAENTISRPKPSYPSGEFSINDTRVIYAKAGTSLLAIAEQYHFNLKWLLDFNDLPSGSDILEKDQLVFLQRKRKQSHHEFHVVETGETLYDIAQQEALRLDQLRSYNHMDKTMIPAPGEKLYLQRKAPARPEN